MIEAVLAVLVVVTIAIILGWLTQPRPHSHTNGAFTRECHLDHD